MVTTLQAGDSNHPAIAFTGPSFTVEPKRVFVGDSVSADEVKSTSGESETVLPHGNTKKLCMFLIDLNVTGQWNFLESTEKNPIVNNPTIQTLFEEEPIENNPKIRTFLSLFEEQLKQLLTLITHLSLSLESIVA